MWTLLRYCISESGYLFGTLGSKDKSYNQTIQSQYFSENKNENHSNEKARLLGSASNSWVSDYSNGETSGKTTQAYTKSCTKIDEAPKR